MPDPSKLTFVEDTHTYSIGDRVLPSVTQIIKAGGAGTDYSGIPEHVLKRAGEIGNRVHKQVELYHTEDSILSTDDDSANAYLEGYAEFLRSGVFTHKQSEQRLYCECHWFAGTVDLWGEVNGSPAILDVKTTNNINQDKVELQTAAYAHLYEVTFDVEVGSRFVVHLRKDGSHRLVPCDDVLAWHKFAKLVQEYYSSD